MPRLRLLTIGHSYVVASTRRLAHEMAKAGGDRWEVTAAAPDSYRGDLRRIQFEPIADEANHLEKIHVRFDVSPHLMWFSGLRPILSRDWDVVHAWQEPYVLAGAQIARATPVSAKLVVASFQNIRKRYPWPVSAFERFTMARADGWIPFGETVKRALESGPLYAGKPCRTLPPGVDVQTFRPDAAAGRRIRERLGWVASDRVVGYLGRFVTEKGLDTLLDALRGTHADWKALFVGGGPLEARLRVFGQEFPGRVHVETQVPHDEVPAWLNAMTVLCAPSRTTARWREQFGRMLIEAMACGVPVAASDSGEIPFVVGDAGMLLPEAHVTAWADALGQLLEDAEARRRYAEAGRERAHSRFAWPVVARGHLAFFESVLQAT